MKSFGLIQDSKNIEFINLYSQDNPILEINDECFFLMLNIFDYHRPLIFKGIVVNDIFVDGMSKVYYVKILELLETPNNLDKFFWNKQFELYQYINETIGTKRMITPHPRLNLNNYVVKVEAFYVRRDLEKIVDLQKDYINVVKKDLKRQLRDIEEF